jgi:hypothetical protein
LDKGNKPDTEGHCVDMVFFKVAFTNSPEKDHLIALTRSHRGDWGDVDPLDGKEHNYMELGAWIGDQGLAMMYMALGVNLGIFRLLSPAMLGLDGPHAMQMAQMGLLSVQSS